MVDTPTKTDYILIMPVLRLKGITGPGLAFVTTTVIDWLPIFKSQQLAKAVAQQLGETASMQDVSIAGYVVMPSHVHSLVGLKDFAKLSSFVKAFKSLSARRLRQFDLESYRDQLYRMGQFRLWKRRFDDVIIVSEEQFRTKLRYIHENPMKAGLVKDVLGWEFSSARSWLLNEPGETNIVKDFRWVAG
jgi:putative transposase